jgi:hypothetical protein
MNGFGSPVCRGAASAKHNRGDGCGPGGAIRAAGIRRYSAPVEFLELPGPGELRPDEVLLEVRGAGVGNWDDIARAGGWDLGRHPPMALGVEAAGVVAETGVAVAGVAAGDRVMAHSLPLRFQGTWAEWFAAAAADVALVPDAVPIWLSTPPPVARPARCTRSPTVASLRRSPPTRRTASVASRSARCTWHRMGRGWHGSATCSLAGHSRSRRVPCFRWNTPHVHSPTSSREQAARPWCCSQDRSAHKPRLAFWQLPWCHRSKTPPSPPADHNPGDDLAPCRRKIRLTCIGRAIDGRGRA